MPLLGHESAAHAQAEKETFWYRKPLRILQTVLRETDAKGYDTGVLVAYMQQTGCNTLVVNGGGIVDFFQNPLPAANINPFVGDRDLLKEIITACHAAGMRVIVRVDFRGVEQHVYRKFPDWFSVDAENKPVQLSYTRPQLYASCYTGHHRNEYAGEFIRYLMQNYNPDGIWHNSIGVGGICYCSRCRDLYKTATGKGIPLQSAAVVELDQYMAWKTVVADQHMERMKNAVKSFGTDKIYSAEVFSMFESGSRINSGIDLYNARDHFDFLVSVAFLTENTDRIHYEDLGYASTIIKFLKSMAPEKEAVILYGGNGTAHRYVMDPPLDLKIWLWEALAAGGRFWNCYFTGPTPNTTHDRRNAQNHTDIYHFVKQHEKVLEQQVPVANVGVYYSRPTRLFYRDRPEEGEGFDTAIKGVEAVLIENHIPYDFVPDDQLSSERLRKYSTIVLPNVRCMSGRETELLKAYVREGGNLLATYATSLYNAGGELQADFSLAELFGVSYTGQKVNTRKDNYQYIVKASHPIVAEDSGDTELLINAAYTLLIKPLKGAEVICTHVPTVHNQPPEKAWVEKWSTEFPTLVQNTYGKGKVLYFANQPDVITHEIGHPDARNLLLRGIRFLAGNSLSLTSDAPESVHIGLTRSLNVSGQYILSLVNTTSGPVRPIRSLVPVHDLTVKLRLGGDLNDHQVLRSQGECSLEQNGEELIVRISRLEDFCAVCVKLEG